MTGWVVRRVMCGVRVFARVTQDKAILAWVSDIKMASFLDTKEEAQQLRDASGHEAAVIELHELTERPDNGWK
jgi:hypothetical protein